MKQSYSEPLNPTNVIMKKDQTSAKCWNKNWKVHSY